MKKSVLAVVCLLLANLGFSQTIRLAPSWTGAVSTEPRATVTLVFKVRNDSSEAQSLLLGLELPEGWRRIVPDVTTTILPETESAFIAAVFVPQEARAGEYSIPASVTDAGSGAVLARETVAVTVLPHLELQIDGLDGSTHVLAGEIIELPFRVANRSNVDLRVDLSLDTRSYYSAEFEGAPEGTITLGASESVRLVARVRTPSVISRVENYSVNVIASGFPVAGEERTTGPVSASFQALVEIIPVVSEEPPPFHTIPARVATSTSQLFGTEWNGTLDLDLDGGGFLDEEGRHRVDFQFTPSFDLDQLSMDPASDTYRLNYAGDLLDVSVGDNGHTISPLLGSYLYGRGGFTRLKPGPFEVAGLYSYPQGVGPSQSTIAGTAAFNRPDPFSLEGAQYRTALNVLSGIGSNVAVSNHHRLTLDGAQADIEFGAGTAVDSDFTWGALVGGQANVAGFDLSGRATYTTPGFPGEFSDQTSVTALLATTIEPIRLQLTGSGSWQRMNPSLIGEVAAQTVDAMLSGRLGLPSIGGTLAVGWKARSRRDIIPAAEFDQFGNTFTATYRMPLGNLHLGADSKIEIDRDSILDARTVSQRYSLTSKLSQSMSTSYSLDVSAFASRSTFYPMDRRVYAAVGVEQNWGPVETEGRLSVSVSSRDRSFSGFSTYLMADADVSLFGDHVLTFDSFVEFSIDPADSGFSGGFTIAYEAPLRIPVSRKRGVGTIEGFAFNEETGEPVQNLIVRASDRAVVTGEEGIFRLSSLQPGEYFVDVDTSRVGPGLIPNRPVPMRVSVVADEITPLDLPIARAATITGTVDLFSAREKQEGLLDSITQNGEGEYTEEELTLDGGIANAVVQASREDEVRRVLTDGQGRFTLTDLRPGTWVVRVASGQIPRYHRLVEEEIQVTVEPGEVRALSFRVHPIRRPVTVISSLTTPLVLQVDTSATEAGETSKTILDQEPVDDVLAPDAAARLVAAAGRRASDANVDAPRLLGLAWASNPSQAGETLSGRIVLDLDEAEDLVSEDSKVPHRLITGTGVVQLGLDGTVVLSFINPVSDSGRLHLDGVQVRIDRESNGLTEQQLEGAYHDLVSLIAARWQVEPHVVEAIAEREIRAAEIANISIRLVLERESGIVEIEYRDLSYESVIEGDVE